MNYLKEFQKQHGLKDDGIAGPATAKKMREVFGLVNMAQVAHLLANVHHETGNFTRSTENLNYSAQGAANTWPIRYAVDPKSKVKVPNALAKKLTKLGPQALANNAYANRNGNGNEASNDGWNYRGRGAIQLTGRANYREFSMFMKNPDILYHPDLVATKYFWESALFFFTKAKLWGKMNHTTPADVKAIRRVVNGGYIGLEDVQAKFDYYYNMIRK